MAPSVFHESLHPEHLKLNLKGEDKESIIRELLDLLEANGTLPDREAAEKAIFERESCMSTGMEQGIAIPHGKTDSVQRLLVAIGLKPEGIDFESGDGKPAKIIVLTLSPASRSGPHIRFIAEISTLLQEAALREKLLASSNPQEMLQILGGNKRK